MADGDMGSAETTARTAGEEVGNTSRELLPVLGDVVEGLWDGVLGRAPDESTDAYEGAHRVGSALPDLAQSVWDFAVGFVSGLFG